MNSRNDGPSEVQHPLPPEIEQFFARIEDAAPEALREIVDYIAMELARADQMRVAATHAVGTGSPLTLDEKSSGEVVPAVRAPVQVLAADVRICRLGKLVVILLPSLLAEGKSWAVLDVLQRLFADTSDPVEWLLDCSSLKTQETIMLSALLGFERELRLRGGKLRLAWLDCSVIPESLRIRFETLFGLMRRAGHYFSR